MNELSLIFERMGLSTRDVIETAATKWNFYRYYPGLVGGLCNSHHLRDLIFVYEQYGQGWAEKISRCLVDIKEEVDLVRQHNDHLDPEKIKVYEARYDKIIEDGLERNQPPQKEPGKRGRV